jgi:hypothetical protein
MAILRVPVRPRKRFSHLTALAALTGTLTLGLSHAHADTTMTACTPLVDATTLTRETFFLLERCPDAVPAAPPTLPGFQAMEPVPAPPAPPCTVTLIPMDPTLALPAWVERARGGADGVGQESLPDAAIPTQP